ncbi:MAG TPA: hypothetical protein PKM65_00885 [Spirochaetota bacterium]|nr:hypothetical protein [Spirochaetota bacterium]HNT11628.1 hypothetical protein [Spirochaetota bacterium]HOS39141.1 hypothetical protein [Spirochaetota bacterium]
MTDNFVVKYSINSAWGIVKEIREKVGSLLQDRQKDLVDATMMTVSELIENAIKYGTPVSSSTDIDFELTITDRTISISISNGIVAMSDYENVKRHLDLIGQSDNPGELYTKRLMELMENPRPGVSQLGLYRIAYEGEFSLSYRFENKILTIFAERAI